MGKMGRAAFSCKIRRSGGLVGGKKGTTGAPHFYGCEPALKIQNEFAGWSVQTRSKGKKRSPRAKVKWSQGDVGRAHLSSGKGGVWTLQNSLNPHNDEEGKGFSILTEQVLRSTIKRAS